MFEHGCQSQVKGYGGSNQESQMINITEEIQPPKIIELIARASGGWEFVNYQVMVSQEGVCHRENGVIRENFEEKPEDIQH